MNLNLNDKAAPRSSIQLNRRKIVFENPTRLDFSARFVNRRLCLGIHDKSFDSERWVELYALDHVELRLSSDFAPASGTILAHFRQANDLPLPNGDGTVSILAKAYVQSANVFAACSFNANSGLFEQAITIPTDESSRDGSRNGDYFGLRFFVLLADTNYDEASDPVYGLTHAVDFVIGLRRPPCAIACG